MPSHSHEYAKLPDGNETYTWAWGDQHRTNVYMDTLVRAGTPSSNNPVTQQGSANQTVATGGGQPFNIMPLYRATYIWRRTA